jgi:hypothetical protein
MIEVLDRVPTHPGRVKLIPVAGQANTYDMVRADEPIVEGTPLNKALFDSIVNVAEAVLSASNWAMGSDGRYSQTIPVSIVSANSKIVIVGCDLDTDDNDARIEIQNAWAWPAAHEAKQGDGTLTFYARQVPLVSIPIFVGVM